jgi:periplasmic protein TonB
VIGLHVAAWALLTHMQARHSMKPVPVMVVRWIETPSQPAVVKPPEPEAIPTPAREAVVVKKIQAKAPTKTETPTQATPQPPAAAQVAIASDQPASVLATSAVSEGSAVSRAATGISAPQASAASSATPPAPSPPKTVAEVEYVQAPSPTYPSVSRRLGEEGKVVLRVLVNTEGKPEDAQVRVSSGHARLDEAARSAALRARFRPYREGSTAVPVWAIVPISFSLNG